MGIKGLCVIGILVALAGCFLARDQLRDRMGDWDADLGLAMVKIDGGRFLMGGTEEQSPGLSENELPVHEVAVSDFYLSKYEITVSQFAIFVDEANYVTDAEKNGYSWIVSDGAPRSWERASGATWQSDESGSVVLPQFERDLAFERTWKPKDIEPDQHLKLSVEASHSSNLPAAGIDMDSLGPGAPRDTWLGSAAHATWQKRVQFYLSTT